MCIARLVRMRAYIISLNFNPGHVSHMVASYKQCEEMGYEVMEMEAILRSLTATTTLTVPKVTSDSLEGLGLRTATCTVHPSQGKFADAGRKSSQNGLLSPDGNFGVQSPDILEGLFEKSFCSTKQVSRFLHS